MFKRCGSIRCWWEIVISPLGNYEKGRYADASYGLI